VEKMAHTNVMGMLCTVTLPEHYAERTSDWTLERTARARRLRREDCAGEETRTTAEKEKSRVVALVSVLAFAGAATRRRRATCRSWFGGSSCLTSVSLSWRD
jgi:hypothetical protein